MKNLITKLANLFPHADKVLHFVAGALIALLIQVIVNEPWFGFAGAFLAGLYKEFSDNAKQQSVSKKYVGSSYLDWLSTIIGGLFIELIW